MGESRAGLFTVKATEAVKILGVAEIARARGGTLAEAAFEYAAERAAFLGGQFGAFRWRCPDCGGLVSNRGPLGNHPAADEQGHAEGGERLAA